MKSPGASNEWASELQDIFRHRQDEILRAIPRGTKYRTDFLVETIVDWALGKFEKLAIVSNYLDERGRRDVARKEFVLDLIIFRQGAIGPLLSAEFEWSSARADKQEKRQALLLERTLADRPSDFVDQAQKDRAFDLLKVFLTRPEMGVFGGWENSRRGGVTSVDELLARDSWIVEGYSRAMPDNLFPLLYLAAVRLGSGRGFDFASRLFFPKNGTLQLVR